MEDDKQAAIEAARVCYDNINIGRHDNPVAGFEFIQAKLQEAGVARQYHLLDNALSENAREAEGYIKEVVIRRSNLRHAAWLQLDLVAGEQDMTQQEVINARNKIVEYCNRSREIQGDLTYERVALVLNSIAPTLQSMANAHITAKDIEHMERGWREFVGKRTSGINPNEIDGTIKEVTLPQPSETISLKCSFHYPESQVVSLFDKLRDLFEMTCGFNGIIGGSIATRIGRDGNKHEVIATVDAGKQGQISGFMEAINDSLATNVAVDSENTITYRTALSTTQGNAQDVMRVLRRRIEKICEEKKLHDGVIVIDQQPNDSALISITSARADRQKLVEVITVFMGEIIKGRGGVAGR